MLVSILIFSLANWLFSGAGINADNYNGVVLVFIKFGIRLALLPLVAGLSYELLRFLAFLPDNVFTNILRAPGLALQKLSTKEPDDGMAEVALKSFLAVQAMDEGSSVPEVRFGQISMADAHKIIDADLAGTNADKSESGWILCDALKRKRAALAEVKEINIEQYRKIKAVTAERKKGRPLWYILGYTDFYGIRMQIAEGALIPRPETELLCEKAIGILNEKDGGAGQSVLDLCTGSGCIALAIAKNTAARITAADIGEAALAVAKKNLEGKALVVQSDMFAALDGKKFDMIICNPPYIETAAIAALDKEIKEFEPLTALDGGADGLDFYRKLALCAHEHMNAGGTLLLEIGAGQAGAVTELLKNNFTDIRVYKDLNGTDRIVETKYEYNQA
jgi:release factor-specific protein-(glutamine-N5) methyltransferase